MKKKTSNLAVSTGTEGYTTLEERILHSNLSEQDKIEIIKIIGRQGVTVPYGDWTYYPGLSVPPTCTGHPDCPQPTVTYCSCCREE
jgi:hypothetical protein